METVAKIFCGRRIVCVKQAREGFYKTFSGPAGKGKFLGEVWWTKNWGRLSVRLPGQLGRLDWESILLD